MATHDGSPVTGLSVNITPATRASTISCTATLMPGGVPAWLDRYATASSLK
jgi:hypothetical protein